MAERGIKTPELRYQTPKIEQFLEHTLSLSTFDFEYTIDSGVSQDVYPCTLNLKKIKAVLLLKNHVLYPSQNKVLSYARKTKF